MFIHNSVDVVTTYAGVVAGAPRGFAISSNDEKNIQFVFIYKFLDGCKNSCGQDARAPRLTLA